MLDIDEAMNSDISDIPIGRAPFLPTGRPFYEDKRPFAGIATPLIRGDARTLALLILATLCYLAFTIQRSAQPYEDAAIVMRYARHVADGHGIVWNVGEHPVDGATDFLFMMMLAGLSATGVGIEGGARLIGLTSHVLTVGVVYVAIRRLHHAEQWMALTSAAYLAVGPATAYVAAAFGTPLFGLLAAIVWVLATKLSEANRPARPRTCWLFALFTLVLGLDRPEGVFLAGFALLAIMFARRCSGARDILVPFIAVFAIIGGAYFVWHWRYFGHIFPNPFYKKGGSIHWSSLEASFTNTALLVGPFWIPFILSLRSPSALRKAVFTAIPVAGFATCWVVLSNEMNMFARYQYAMLPMVLISGTGLVTGLSREWTLPNRARWGRRQRTTAALALVCGVLGVLTFQRWRYSVPFMQDGRYTAALILREYQDKHYTLVTSEAGLLPFYSGWTALDAWGLNDAWIAHSGSVSFEYLDRFKPNVIMFNGRGLAFEKDSPDLDPWDNMVRVLRQYSQDHHYRLAAVFGVNPYTAHYYYVRRDFADADAITMRLSSMTYRWRGSSIPAVNFLDYCSN